MKKFMQKGFIQKLIISIICCMIMLNFCMTSTVQASFGGKLMTHIIDFATSIADAVGTLVQFALTGEFDWVIDEDAGTVLSNDKDYFKRPPKKVDYPILQVSPEVIFANKVQFLDVNFISNSKGSEAYRVKLKGDGNALDTLRKVIAGWYVTLRTIAVVGLLSVLIYIGIKIIISSTGQDKAKYKQRLVDWLVAFCLLFLMHYIMAALITVVEKVDNVLGDMANIDAGIPLGDYGQILYTGDTELKAETGSEVTAPDGDGVLYDVTAYFAYKYNGKFTPLSTKGEPGYWTIKVTGLDDWNDDSETASNSHFLYLFNDNRARPQACLCVIKLIGEGDDRHYEVDFRTTTEIEDALLFALDNTYDSTGREYHKGNEEDEMAIRQMAAEDRKEVQEIIERINNTIRNNGTGTPNINSAMTSSGDTIDVLKDPSRVLYFTNYARLMTESNDDDENIATKAAFLILYIALIIFTAVFTFRYLKRVMYIAFLTLMAPMVALTYPLDKLKDRKSTSMGYVV